MWHRLAANFRFSSLCRLPRFTDHMQLLIHQASSAIQRAVQDPFDDTWNMEIFDELLETWTLLGTFIQFYSIILCQ
jgi:hypothetical protein